MLAPSTKARFQRGQILISFIKMQINVYIEVRFLLWFRLSRFK